MSEPTPQVEYARRLLARQRTLAELDRRERALSNARLAVFVAAGGLAVAAALAPPVPWATVAIPLAGFVALVLLHDRALRARRRAQLAVTWYERAVARLEHRWQGSGVDGAEHLADDHPYARDLDLFGRGSLFELLCTARTRGGQITLARWLGAPAGLTEARARQEAVAELRRALDLREDLAVEAGDIQGTLHPETLVRWGTAPGAFAPAAALRIALISWTLTLAAPAAVTLWATGITGPFPLIGVALVEALVGRWLRQRVAQVLDAVSQPERELLLLSRLLARLEQPRFEAPWLRASQGALAAADGEPGSVAVARLDRLVTLLDAQRNAFFAPIGFLLMWRIHLALAIERWRQRAGGRVAGWLEAVGRLEAISALSGYAYERPHDPFPDLVEEGPCFAGESLGHPLLADDVCVRNSVDLGEPVRALIVSGSNMSGKSTLLRTVGVNAVLALAGAPVRARSLRISDLQVGATIRVQDSLQEGSSRFYAEITRLKHLVDLTTGPRAVLFLLDEILHGTNSHDRTVGASALVAQLVERGAVGLVTTHDLAISRVAEEAAGRIANVHFVDHLEDGKLVFDYVLRPGVVTKSNALELMRAVGLEV